MLYPETDSNFQSMSSKSEPFQFEGFENPNTTPVPDVLFDRLLAKLGEAELKALLYIIRRTFGFKKDRDPVSFSQFLRSITTKDGEVQDEGCGIRDRTTLSKALQALEQKGIIESEKAEMSVARISPLSIAYGFGRCHTEQQERGNSNCL
jgi:hypothetical protein